jgi:hypothetical protein
VFALTLTVQFQPNFMLPTGDTNNPNFGKSTAAFAPRVGQLALRFDF